MKRFIFLISAVLLSYLSIYPQITLPAQEHFDYSIGDLTTVGSPNWNKYFGVTNKEAQVVTGNLSYPDYPMTETGNRLYIQEFDTMAIDGISFPTLNAPGTKVYASFLIQIISNGGITPEGSYFCGFSDNNIQMYDNAYARLFIRALNSELNFGISKNSSDTTNIVWMSNSYMPGGAPLLVVLGYEFVEGTQNDIVSFWINPDLTGPEPTPTLSATARVNDGVISNFFIRLYECTNAYIDAIRIATSWSQAPLPVELSQFTGAVNGNSIKLDWMTETEVNNYGFEIHRQVHTSTPLSVTTGWEKIGFVNGNGNSNSPRNYTFEDENIDAGIYSYRLKQIDNDGQFEYSKIIEVDFGVPGKFELNPELSKSV